MTAEIFSTTYIIIALTIITMHISTYESYNLKCPSQVSWKIRANVTCNSILQYTCLFNNVEKKYVEGCRGPDWDRKGSKRIFSGFFTRGKCNQSRFQPFKFKTNESMSDCVYAKSICSEAGHIMQSNGSAKFDTTCRCNHRKNYSFVTSPRNVWYCIPIEEDCSCYVKSCPVNFTLSSEYKCIQIDYMDNQKYKEKQQNETLDWKTEFQMDLNDTTSWKMLEYQTAATILCCLVIFIVGGFFFAVLICSSQNLHSTNREKGMQKTAVFKQWTRETVQILKRYLRRLMRDPNSVDNTDEEITPVCTFNGNSDIFCTSVDKEQKRKKRVNEEANHTSKRYAVEADTTDNKIKLVNTVGGSKDEPCTFVDKEQNIDELEARTEQINALVHIPAKLSILSTEEIYFLQIVHLLFRVACPVVRLIFDNEIKPDNLRKKLDENKVLLENLYRKKEKSIEDFQWGLLFPKVKGKKVTSEDFDVKLMIYLLRFFINLRVSDEKPVESDTSQCIMKMLPIINNIRNETIRKFDGKLLETQFNQYWDGIGRAVRNLVSSTTLAIEKNKVKMMPLIEKVLSLNPINIDNKKLCSFIDMSENYPGMILQQLVTEYCKKIGLTLEEVLKKEKHELYHKRIETCCECSKCMHTFSKVITEEQWGELYEVNEDSEARNCTLSKKTCVECFVPKWMNICDLSVAKVLVLNIPNMLIFMIRRLCISGFEKFLVDNQHTLYHAMKREMCCKCNKFPTEKGETLLIDAIEWNTLFIKDAICGHTRSNDCCCQYSIRNGIEYTDIDHTLLSKIFSASGPFGVLNKIEQHPVLSFLNWIDDDQILQTALMELSNVIIDSEILSNHSQPDENIAKLTDARRWISRHLEQQQITTEQQLQILIDDEDGFNVKYVPIPQGFLHRKKKITDIATNENYFLIVVHGLTQIVHPLLTSEICKHYDKSDERSGISKQQKAKFSKDSPKKEKRKKKDKFHQTQAHQSRLSPQKREEMEKLDLESLINILKQTPIYKGDNKYKDQLNVIEETGRDIFHNSSGMLSQTRFQYIMNRLYKAALYLGGKKVKSDLSKIQQIENILE